ncbi:hypothetical protein SAMN02745857_00508 [Andreprevotia lacus DSM 23236]|jgi:hypothetical protein|uniref:Uncharacterized protein n=1 Tax=Andreprevotia lacus DSM 23236 TaxID=1121001 RepID=A0A1W1X2X1_9NEIS|nr:hypothetical protein [Andreprevotia lacus]SMC18247.1 hypothetical protein SAMN02745857_00508 [Andreprevotia lacus DSM 23236]
MPANAAVSTNNGTTFDYAYAAGFNGDSVAAPATAGDYTISKVEFGQINLMQVGDPYFALTANRDVLVRVSVLGSVANLVAPNVALSLKDASGSTLFNQVLSPKSANMVLPTQRDVADTYVSNTTSPNGPLPCYTGRNVAGCPSTSATVVKTAGASIPDLYHAYIVKIPAANLPAGTLTLVVNVQPGTTQQASTVGNTLSVQIQPRTVAPMDLTLVPFQVAGVSPTLPSTAHVTTIAMRYFPVSQVVVRQRAPIVVADTVLGGKTPAQYGDARQPLLAVLDTTYQQDGVTSSYYLGVVPGTGQDIGGITLGRGSGIALFGDSTYDINDSLRRELNNGPAHFGEVNAANGCGSDGGAILPSTFADGGLNGVWGVDLISDGSKITLQNPAKNRSIAGYCMGQWSSSYQVKTYMRDAKMGKLNATELNTTYTTVDPVAWW